MHVPSKNVMQMFPATNHNYNHNHSTTQGKSGKGTRTLQKIFRNFWISQQFTSPWSTEKGNRSLPYNPTLGQSSRRTRKSSKDRRQSISLWEATKKTPHKKPRWHTMAKYLDHSSKANNKGLAKGEKKPRYHLFYPKSAKDLHQTSFARPRNAQEREYHPISSPTQ